MNTNQLDKIIKRMCGNYYMGAFPVNHMPRPNLSRSTMFVANTHSCYRKGEHWVCIYIDSKGNGEFFDSFGIKPNKIFRTYMNNNCKHWIYNSTKLQSIVSNVCGQYCVFYCAYRCKDFNMRKIVSLFTTDTTLNDSLVYNFVKRRL